jgi:hypothetical protein
MTPKLIIQPTGSLVCGQACVAMLLGWSLAEACAIFKHEKGTRTRDLVRVLRVFGVECPDKLITISRQNPIPERCIMKVSPPTGTRPWWSHWTLRFDGVTYDPSTGRSYSIDIAADPNVRVRSFLPVSVPAEILERASNYSYEDEALK